MLLGTGWSCFDRLMTIPEAEKSLIWVYLPIYERNIVFKRDDSVPGAILKNLMGDIAIFGQDLAAEEEIDVKQRLSLAENKSIYSGTSFA